MDTLGVPHVTDTLGVNVNVIAEGFYCLLVSERADTRKARWSLDWLASASPLAA